MSVSVRIKNNRLYLDVIQNRVHHWESLHIKLDADPATRKEQLRLAEMCRAKRELQLVSGEWNFKDGVSGKKTLLQYITEKTQDCNHSTNALYKAKKYLKEYKEGNIQLAAITPEWIDAFQKYMLTKTGLSQTSASHYTTAIRTLLNTAVKERILTNNPAKIVKGIPLEETNKPTLSLEELRAFAAVDVLKFGNTCKQTQRAFVFACFCGLRISDIYTLKWENIEKRPLNKYNKSPYWIHKKQEKTKKMLDNPISQKALECIEPRGLPAAPVFPAIAKLSKKQDVNRYVHRIAKLAGIEKDIAFHTARRTFATLELENGVDPFTVQKLMGHSNINMTAIYAKTDRIKSGAVAALDQAIDLAESEELQKMA